jgi:hypothetical protein
VRGALSSTRLRLGSVLFGFEPFEPGSACVSLISLDGAPIESSKRLLLTAVGQVRNAEAATRPRFDSLGQGPPLAQYVPLSLSLPGRWQASALDLRGAPTRVIAVSGDHDSEVRLPAEARALSFLLTSR